jgi:hypothetical protein
VLGLLEEARQGRAISGPVIDRAGSSPLSPSSANALFANANTVRSCSLPGGLPPQHMCAVSERHCALCQRLTVWYALCSDTACGCPA